MDPGKCGGQYFSVQCGMGLLIVQGHNERRALRTCQLGEPEQLSTLRCYEDISSLEDHGGWTPLRFIISDMLTRIKLQDLDYWSKEWDMSCISGPGQRHTILNYPKEFKKKKRHTIVHPFLEELIQMGPPNTGAGKHTHKSHQLQGLWK